MPRGAGEEEGLEATRVSGIRPHWEAAGSTARIRLVTDPAENSGWLAVVESVLLAGFALPFHVHGREDEVVSVLEGELKVYLDGRERTIRTGEVAFLPRGREHSIAVVRGRTRTSSMFTPAGFEGLVPVLWEAGDPDADDGAVERLLSVAAEYGCGITGAPPRDGRASK